MEDPDPEVVERLRKGMRKSWRARIDDRYCLLLSRDLPSSRLDTTEWCSCGSCVPFSTVRENVCCREALESSGACAQLVTENEAVRGLRQKLKECDQCIVHHRSFHKIALDREVLCIMLEQMRFEKKKHKRHVEDENKCIRYCAYRSFVFWCYGRLGLGRRFGIPACVRGAIVKKFLLNVGAMLASRDSAITEALTVTMKSGVILSCK